ncbi:MAG: hypothetical protein EAX86_13295 [Candidatus Heimdallarchaeota archaeon]|nr:hypothetical protein [Candidatus Heimdallarchaeota archaeon]
MEALKHTEWTLGVIFFWFAIFRISIQGNLHWFLIILIGSQLADFMELFLIRLNMNNKLARKLTHDYGIVLFLWFIFPFNLHPEISLFTTSMAVHYLIDLFSGLEPIYIFGLIFGEKTAILYVTQEHRVLIGKRIEAWGSNYLVAATENPTPELAWFWVMQLSGTMFCGFAIIAYLFSQLS